MRHAPLQDDLTRLERWCREGDRLPEKALETLLRLDVFWENLGYSAKDAVPQPAMDPKRTGVADIALKVNQRDRKRWIVVEVKRPARDLADRAIPQAAGYMIRLGATRGIVTDGRTWVFLRTRLKRNTTRRYLAEVLLRVELGAAKSRQRKVLAAALGRCARTTIWNFFGMLENVRDLGPEGINAAMARVPLPKLPDAIRRAVWKTQKRRMGNRDLGVLKLACGDIETLQRCILGAHARTMTTVKGR